MIKILKRIIENRLSHKQLKFLVNKDDSVIVDSTERSSKVLIKGTITFVGCEEVSSSNDRSSASSASNSPRTSMHGQLGLRNLVVWLQLSLKQAPKSPNTLIGAN